MSQKETEPEVTIFRRNNSLIPGVEFITEGWAVFIPYHKSNPIEINGRGKNEDLAKIFEAVVSEAINGEKQTPILYLRWAGRKPAF